MLFDWLLRARWLLRSLTVAVAWIVSAQAGQQWPRWRGPHDNGSTDSGHYPVKFDGGTNLLWKAPLPGIGCSTPAVWDQRIYLTAPADGQDAVLAFDWSGQQLWQKTLGPERPGKNKNGSGSNPSPVTDGQRVFVYFKSGNLAAVALDGQIQWKTNLVERYGADTLYWDYGTSPVLTEKDVIIALMHHGESWLAAFDKISGSLHWKVARNYETPDEGDHRYATPIIIRHESKEAILVWGGLPGRGRAYARRPPQTRT
jgi:outer membrane protein assembly factor BamB